MNLRAAVSLFAFVAAAAYWLSERLRDAAMWPINLVRDFPLRSARLLKTLRGAVPGGPPYRPKLLVRKGKPERSSPTAAGRAVTLCHRCLAELFDLLGGPEIAQFFLRFFTTTTPLTAEEVAAVSTVLGRDAMRYADVRVAQGGLLELVFRFNGSLAFATWHTVHLPRAGRRTRENLPLLVHELMHVYQYERVGSRYLGEAVYVLVKTRRDCYDYGGTEGLLAAYLDGRCYADFNREQQAMIGEHYFVRERGGRDVSAYLPFISQLRHAEL